MNKVNDSQSLSLNLLSISLDGVMNSNNAATIHTMKLADAISRQINKVTLVMMGKKNYSETKNNLNLICVKLPRVSNVFIVNFFNLLIKNFKLYKKGSEYARECSYIYERHNIASIVGLLLAKRYKKKLFFEVNSLSVDESLDEHNIKNKYITKILNNFMKWQLSKASGVFVQTTELGELINRYYGPVSTIVVPNGTELNKEISKSYIKNKQLKFIYLGAIDKYHTINELLEAFSIKQINAELTIVGGGNNLSELRKKYSQKNIKFLGEVSHDKVANLLEVSDIGIAQYNLETRHFKKYGFYFCPIKIIEYAANSLPTVYIGKPNSFIKEFELEDACIVIESIRDLRDLVKLLTLSPKKLIGLSKNAYKKSKSLTWEEAGSKTIGAMYV